MTNAAALSVLLLVLYLAAAANWAKAQDWPDFCSPSRRCGHDHHQEKSSKVSVDTRSCFFSILITGWFDRFLHSINLSLIRWRAPSCETVIAWFQMPGRLYMISLSAKPTIANAFMITVFVDRSDLINVHMSTYAYALSRPLIFIFRRFFPSSCDHVGRLDGVAYIVSRLPTQAKKLIWALICQWPWAHLRQHYSGPSSVSPSPESIIESARLITGANSDFRQIVPPPPFQGLQRFSLCGYWLSKWLA